MSERRILGAAELRRALTRLAHEIVERNCLKHGVRYSSHSSLGRALRSHFLHLRTMGRLGLPPEIEMG